MLITQATRYGVMLTPYVALSTTIVIILSKCFVYKFIYFTFISFYVFMGPGCSILYHGYLRCISGIFGVNVIFTRTRVCYVTTIICPRPLPCIERVGDQKVKHYCRKDRSITLYVNISKIKNK